MELPNDGLGVRDEPRVGDDATGQTPRCRQGAQGVPLPQGNAVSQAQAIASLERLGHLQGRAIRQDAHRNLHPGAPDRQRQAQPRVLEHPGAVRIHLENDALELLAQLIRQTLSELLLRKAGDFIPGAVKLRQQPVIQLRDIRALPKALLVIRRGLANQMSGTHIGAHHIDQPCKGGGTRAVHAED